MARSATVERLDRGRRESSRKTDAAQAHAEAVFLELALLRHCGSQLVERRVLTAQQLCRLHRTIDDVRELLAFESTRLSSCAVRSIDRAQNRLFDEVHDVAPQWFAPRRRANSSPDEVLRALGSLGQGAEMPNSIWR